MDNDKSPEQRPKGNSPIASENFVQTTGSSVESTGKVPSAGSPESMSTAGVPTSIYPEPTKGVGVTVSAPMTSASVNPPASANVSATTFSTNSNVLIVRLVAGVLIVLNLINAYDWLHEGHTGLSSWLNAIEIAVELCLAVGIISLKEAARALYVFLGSALVGLTVINLVILHITTTRNSSSPSYSASTQTSITKAQVEYSLQKAEQNTALPAKARQEDINALKRELSTTGNTPAQTTVKQDTSIGLSFVGAVLPLIILTRRPIREVFH